MNALLATTRNRELGLAAVLAGVAALFLIAGAIAAVVGHRRRERGLEITDRDRADDGSETTANS
jgi:hypothetical protein